MLKYHKNVEDHRFPHFQHHRKERKITMKKRCLSLLLTLCLLAALAVPAFAQEAEKQPTLQPASEHPSVLLNTPAVEIPARPRRDRAHVRAARQHAQPVHRQGP